MMIGRGAITLYSLPLFGSLHYEQDHFWCPYTTEAADSCDSFEVLQDPTRAAEELKA